MSMKECHFLPSWIFGSRSDSSWNFHTQSRRFINRFLFTVSPKSLLLYSSPYSTVSNDTATISTSVPTATAGSNNNNTPKAIATPPSSGQGQGHDGKSSPTSPNNDVSTTETTKEIDWVGLIADIVVSITMAVVSSMILSYITRKFFRGLQGSTTPTEDSLQDNNTSETQVYQKLKQILVKRSSRKAMNTNTNDNQTKAVLDVPVPPLSSRELQMADEIIDPDDIECNFTDIGGLDDMKREIYELAIVPLLHPQLYNPKSKLVQPVKGILLYGKPGTGKTMIAKALAKESCAIFLPLQLSKILNKYWGESNKLIAATFSLAHKLQPAVIFIDELDTFLKNSNSETAYMDSIKAEFLTLWDGIGTTSNSRVLVLGATNKPQHIDTAILRRMPRAFEVPLPNASGRLAILELLFKDEHIDETVIPALSKLVDITEGYSGSDLKELCKAAAMVSVSEHTAEFARRRVMGEPESSLDEALERKIRPITESDLVVGYNKVRRTGEAAYRYGKKQQVGSNDEGQPESNNDATTIDIKSLQNFAKLLRALSTQIPNETNDDNDTIPNL